MEATVSSACFHGAVASTCARVQEEREGELGVHLCTRARAGSIARGRATCVAWAPLGVTWARTDDAMAHQQGMGTARAWQWPVARCPSWAPHKTVDSKKIHAPLK